MNSHNLEIKIREWGYSTD